MKHIVLTILFLSLGSLLFGQSRIKFDSTSCHLGRYEEGPDINFKLKFKNIGTKPILILNASESGYVGICTYPKDTIYPKKENYIGWFFPTSSRVGNNSKQVIITLKDTTMRINMYFEIIPKKESSLIDTIKY
jgi:Protein of unknown function (DUF1573)